MFGSANNLFMISYLKELCFLSVKKLICNGKFPWILKGQFTQKRSFCDRVLSFQTCLSSFPLLSTKEYILKNTGNRTIVSILSFYFRVDCPFKGVFMWSGEDAHLMFFTCLIISRRSKCLAAFVEH